MIKIIGNLLKIDAPLISFIPDRAGHDFRYSVNCSKIKKLGWDLHSDFEHDMYNCVKWYIANKDRYGY
jgi:dTDP-glucose 4,6-dehydratase